MARGKWKDVGCIRYTCFMTVKRDEIIAFLHNVYPLNFLDDHEISRIVEESDLVYFDPQKIILREDSKASYLYIIFEGQIELLKEKKRALVGVNYLKQGDLFGLEVVGELESRQTSARAVDRVLLVRISKNLIQEIKSRNLRIDQMFEILNNSYKSLLVFEVKDDVRRETIHFASRPHPFGLFLRILGFAGVVSIPLLASILLNATGIINLGILLTQLFIELLILGVWSLWQYIDWRKDWFIFTSERVINSMKRLFTQDLRVETPLHTITNLNFEKNFFGRRFNFGDLYVKTYTGASLLRNVPHVENVQSLLEYIWKKEMKNAIQEEATSFERMLMEKEILDGTMPDMAVDTTISPTNKDQVAATYRTHWLILIKKVLVPSSLLLCNLLLFLFLSSNGVDILSNNLWPVIILVIQSGLIVWWLYQFFDWRNDHYIITREQIIDLYQRPFGLRNQRTAPLENIQSIRYEKKGLLGILLNFGTVYIRIGDEEFTFDKVPDPSAVQEKIYTIFNNRIEEMNKKKLTDQQRRLAGWMETFHRIKEKKKSDESLSE